MCVCCQANYHNQEVTDSEAGEEKEEEAGDNVDAVATPETNE